jgi:hypothetical protein
MEGQGCYNAHSRPQQAAASLGIALLTQAAERVGPVQGAIVIADYGSAEGRNSLAPIKAAIQALRRQHGCAPIDIVHVDQGGNDFNSLFHLLQADPESYLRGTANVFAYAAAGSFYDRIFPAGHVSLGWCSIALHWLGGLPAGVEGHAWPSRLTGLDRVPFAWQAAADWRAFLRHRSAELRPGGRLVVVVPATDHGGVWSMERLAAGITAVLQAMVADGSLREAEFRRMVVPTYHRNRAEFEAPFADPDLDLVVEAQSLASVPDPLWEAFRMTGDTAALANGYAGIVRAAFGPTLANALDADRSADERRAFVTRLEAGIRERTIAAPSPLCVPVIMTMLIAKPIGGLTSARTGSTRSSVTMPGIGTG